MCVTIRRVKRLSLVQPWMFLVSLGIGSALLLAFVGGLWMGALTADLSFPRRGRGPLPVLDEAWRLVAVEYYGELPPAPIRNRGAIRGLLATLQDPYTVLLDPEPAHQEQQRLSGRHGSIGVSLWWADNGTVALTPYPESPAALAGIRADDRLLAIDGVRLDSNFTLDAVASRLEGEVGTTVFLTLRRDSEEDEFSATIVRAEVLQPSVEWRMLAGADAVGYLRLYLFTAQTPDEVRQAIQDLVQQGMRMMVFDLRGNGGGMLADLDVIGGAFLPAGKTLYYDVSETEERQIQVSGAQLFDGPLSVLVDGGTASAAEILAAALRDHNRALLIGEQTYGKSSIQALYPLQDGSLLHVTHAVWLTPGRVRLDGNGLVPDVPVSPRPGADAALESAIVRLRLEE